MIPGFAGAFLRCLAIVLIVLALAYVASVAGL